MQLTLPEVLNDADHGKAVTALRTYFGLDVGSTPYTGAFIERLGGSGDRGEVRDLTTTEDLVAVTMLTVDVLPAPYDLVLRRALCGLTNPPIIQCEDRPWHPHG
jgi:hypothetical protein